jgi:acyl-CoA thioester hydrolase
VSAPFRFEHETAVRWSDLDAAGVVNNAVYLSLLEEARFGYFAQLGLLRGEQFPFLVGETSVRFQRPLVAPGAVTVAARTSRLGTKSMDMEYEVRRGGEVVATARATLVWADGLVSREIPGPARRSIAELEGIAPSG